MLYQFHEWQRTAMAPVRLAAEAQQQILRHPFNPLAYLYAGRAAAAALDVFEQTVRPRGKPAFGFETAAVAGRSRPVREEILGRMPFCQLKHFQRPGAGRDPRVLVVAPLSCHFATLLRGTVEALIPDHDVYITDWRDARQVTLAKGPFDLDDYVDAVIDFLHLLGPDTHVIAVCQPAVPVLAAVALMSEREDPAVPRSMTLMGGPIDTRRNPTVPNKLATSRDLGWFERHAVNRVPMPYPGFLRRVYPGFLQLSGFMTMNLERHVDAHVKLYHNLIKGDGDGVAAHQRFYEEYLSVMDLPAEYYLQTVKTVFQDHALPRGRLTHRGHKVDPGAITRTALLTVEGELDDISGLGQTEAAHALCRGLPKAKRGHHVQAGVGHYGVFNGRRWRTEIAPKVKAFIAKHG